MKIQDDIIQEIKNMEKMFPGIFFEYFEENSANLHYIFVSDKNIFENEEFAKLEAKVITRLETYEDSIISFLDKTMKNEIYSFNEFVVRGAV